MKKFLLACVAVLPLGGFAENASMLVTPNDSGIPDVHTLAVEYATMHCDFTINVSRLHDHSLQNEFGTCPQQFCIDRKTRSWIVPWCIGKPDTKRHYRWKAFVRKVC